MNGKHDGYRRRKITRKHHDGVLRGAFMGLLAFTVLAVVVFGVMLISRTAGSGTPAVTTEPITDAPNTAPMTDAPDTGTPSTDEPSTNAPSTEPPATEPPQTEPPVTDPPAPPVPQDKRVSFLACGDNIVHDAVREDAQKRANADNPGFNFYDMYAGVKDEIAAADISFINMEGCVGGASLGYLGYPNFNAPNQIGEAFIKLGFDVVNLLNNHTLDYGEKGYKNTIEFFNTLPVLTLGGYTKSDFDNLRVIDKNGVKIAFLSYTTMVNFRNFGEQLPGSEYYIAYAEDADIKRQIAAARASADFVVVSMHWGDEDSFYPNGEQTRLAQLCADMGADVVVGHHSHTVQPAKWLTGKNGNKTFVAYSLGNFISTMHYSQNMAGVMLSLDFVVEKDGTKYVDAPTLIPTVCHYSLQRDALQIYRMSDYSEELAKKHGSTLQNSFSYAILKKYITDNINAQFIEW
ncbi:MAG: CapA family protein [Clostridia bacterium]|nr:CapA family protein [Clostridia bacterium]